MFPDQSMFRRFITTHKPDASKCFFTPWHTLPKQRWLAFEARLASCPLPLAKRFDAGTLEVAKRQLKLALLPSRCGSSSRSSAWSHRSFSS
jgi:hypothetical protein